MSTSATSANAPATVQRPPQPPAEIDSSRSAAIAIGLTTNGSSIARNPL